jgi:hypothetical protein
MDVIDASEMKAREILFEGFGLAYPLKGIAQGRFDEPVDALEGSSTLGLPIQITLPPLSCP